MHLEDELCLRARSYQFILHLTHRDLDDISSRALHGMIHGRTLTKTTLLRIARIEFRNIASAPEECLSIPIRLGLLDDPVEIGAHPTICSKITIDHVFGIAEGNIERLRKPIGLLTVHDAEVNRLRTTAQKRRNLFERHIEHSACRLRMKIFT